jgi:hypothetical protein
MSYRYRDHELFRSGVLMTNSRQIPEGERDSHHFLVSLERIRRPGKQVIWDSLNCIVATKSAPLARSWGQGFE